MEWLRYISESKSNMTKCQKHYTKTGMQKDNADIKSWRSLWMEYVFFQKRVRESEWNLKGKCPIYKKANIIINYEDYFHFCSQERKKYIFKSIPCILVIREHLASSNISSHMVFLKDVRKEISNCNLNKYW